MQKIHDKQRLFNFLQQHPFLYLYHIGDLDELFWEKTEWLAQLDNQGQIQALLLIYQDYQLPIVLMLCPELETALIKKLISKSLAYLPSKFYAHFTPNLYTFLEQHYTIQNHTAHQKMGITASLLSPQTAANPNIRKLQASDLNATKKLLDIAYPDNWFNPKLFVQQPYFGYFQNEELIAISGLHVYSETYNVAALGNICTHPKHRKKNLARQTIHAHCLYLFQKISQIGLNVELKNNSAINLYRKLGFKQIALYNEADFILKTNKTT